MTGSQCKNFLPNLIQNWLFVTMRNGHADEFCHAFAFFWRKSTRGNRSCPDPNAAGFKRTILLAGKRVMIERKVLGKSSQRALAFASLHRLNGDHLSIGG